MIPIELSKRIVFEGLAQRIKQCHRCEGLNIAAITESAPGFGNLNSKIMIIGQSLCTRCMKTQIPFTGGSGRLLNDAFELAGVSKSDMFITNVVHCHTPNNRKSLPHEIANCHSYLVEEIRIVGPKAIVPLGQDAVISILGKEAWPSFVGKRVDRESDVVYPMYHPSYILKKGARQIRKYTLSLANILKRETE